MLAELLTTTAKRGTPLATLKDKAKSRADAGTMADGSVWIPVTKAETDALYGVAEALRDSATAERGAKLEAAARIRRFDQMRKALDKK